MPGPRDTQRQRLYDAESAIAEQPMDMAEVLAFVKEVTSSSWWRNRGGSQIQVRDGRGRRRAAAYGSSYITLPRWSRYRSVILHELAHTMTPSGKAAHGSEFAANLLGLVRRFMGSDASEKLKASFKRHRVKARGANPVRVRPIRKHSCRRCHKLVAHPWRLAERDFCSKRCALEWAHSSVTRPA